MKKLTLRVITLALAFILSACGNLYNGFDFGSASSSGGLKYKISDENVKKWVVERNKVEQCLYPKEVRTRGVQSLSKGDQLLYQMAVSNRTLSQIIGSSNYAKLSTDPASQQYLVKRFQKFNHNKTARFEKAWCSALKIEYGQAVKSAKASAKKSSAETAKQTSKSATATSKQTQAKQAGRVQEEIEYKDPLDSLEVKSDGNVMSQEHISLKQKVTTSGGKQAEPGKIRITWEPVKKEVYSY